MIDSNKLLPDRGTTITLSRGSVKKVALIERKLILIDSLLKEKLILSKVREGIRRQEEERIKRTQQEIDLEKEEDDKDDPDADAKRKKKPKDPKGGGGVSLVGSALIGAAGVSLAKNAGLIIGAAKAATVLITGGIGLGIAIAEVSKQFDNLQKSVASFGPAGSVAIKVSNAFLFTFKNFVSAAILVGIFNAVPASRFKIRENLATRIRQIGKKKVPTKVVLPEGEPNFVREIKKIKVKEKINPKIRTQENLVRQKPLRERKPKFLTGDELKKRINIIRDKGFEFSGSQKKLTKKFTRTGNPLSFIEEDQFVRSKRITKKFVSEDFFPTKLPQVRIGDMPGLLGSNPKIIRLFNREISDYNFAKINSVQKAAASSRINQMLKATGLKDLEIQEFFKGNKNITELRRLKSLEGGNPFGNKFFDNRRPRSIDPENIFTSQPLTFDTPSFFNRSRLTNKQILQSEPFLQAPNIPKPTITSKQILSQQGTFTAPKIVNQVTKNADNLTNVKSLSKLLEAFGGIPLVKATRKIFDNTLGRIPLLGDLLGILLDVFVFKEPVGRAVFMAAGGALGGSIGAWLGGILGTAVPVVGNLAGAVVGGFLGGIGGDMLGGFLYDRIIGGKQDPQPLTEKALKSTSRLALNGGGLVPNLAMQGGGMTPDVGSFASYENPRGRVAVKTVLLPLNSESDEASEATVLTAGRSKGRSNFETLYKGGLV